MPYNIQITQTEKSKRSSIDFNNLPFGKICTDHMFEADYVDGNWTNIRIVPIYDLPMHPTNLALHYGQSIFEGMKASANSDGIPLLFRPEMHAKRLNRSARRMCMPEIPEDLFIQAIKALVGIEKDWIPEAEGSALYIRPIMFATDEYIGVTPSNSYKFIIITLPVGPYYAKPVKLLVEEKYVRAVNGGTGEAKTAGNYAASLLPAKIAQEKGYDQVIWMDAHEFKHIQEVGTMNLFFVFKDKVVTPATDGAILHGITRDSFIHLLQNWKIPIEERPITIDEVKQAYLDGELIEVFGAGTAAVAATVSKISHRDFHMEFSSANWDMSTKLKNAINDLRSAKVKDTFGWIVPLEVPVTA